MYHTIHTSGKLFQAVKPELDINKLLNGRNVELVPLITCLARLRRLLIGYVLDLPSPHERH